MTADLLMIVPCIIHLNLNYCIDQKGFLNLHQYWHPIEGRAVFAEFGNTDLFYDLKQNQYKFLQYFYFYVFFEARNIAIKRIG